MGYTHGHKWNDEEVERKIEEVMHFYGIERMPTRGECEQYFGDKSLTNRITKTYGWYALADKLGLPVKDCETTMGKRWEAYAAQHLTDMGHTVERMAQNYPYDLLVDGCVKVDVKASRLYHGKNGNFYTFSTEKKYCTCDIYLLYMVSDDEDISAMVIPGVEVFHQCQITAGEHHSKYYRYLERWELIDRYAELLMSMKA